MATSRQTPQTSKFVLIVLAVVLPGMSPLHAALTHRYDFSSDGSDLVGTADWTVNGATFSGGQVQFDGVDDFLSLGSTILPTGASDNMTIEVWGTYDPNTATGSRIFDFSTVSGDAGFYQYLTPVSMSGDTQWRFDDGFGIELGPINQGSPGNTGQEILYTLVYDSTVSTPQGTGEMQLYRNGVFVAADATESIAILQRVAGTTSNRLGHGQSEPGDPNGTAPAFLTGSINEFRVYDHALNSTDILVNAVSGPDTTSISFTDKTWNTANGDWNSGGNWTSAGVPGTGDRAVISNGGTTNVNSAVPDVGNARITGGNLNVGTGGSLNVLYPIGLGNGATINVTGGGVLGTSGVLVEGTPGTHELSIDNGTLQAASGTAILGEGVSLVVGTGGAVIDSQSGSVSIAGEISGTGDVTVNGSNIRVRDDRIEVPGLQNPNYSGTWHVTDSVMDVQGSHGALGTANEAASNLVIEDSTLVINTGVTSSVNFKRVPINIEARGNVELINTSPFDNTFRYHGNLTGDGTIHYTVPFSPEPIGIDFENRDNPADAENPFIVDNSGFTGRFIIDDDTATRFRTDLADLPNAIFDMAGDGAWTAKRGSDENQVIQLGGLAGVGPDEQLQIDSGDTAGFGSRLEASIAGEGDVGGFTAVTYEIGGASQDAEYFGIIRDTPFTGGHDVVTVVKVGDNTQAFSGQNSYSGPTTVNAGTLLINGTHAQAVSDIGVSANDPANYDGLPVGDYTVNAGGTLGGTGTIGSETDSVNVTVVGGTLAPGASPGTLTINGNYSQDASSTLAIEIGGTPGSGLFDLLDVSGNASLAGLLNVSVVDNPALTVGDQFTVLSATSLSGGDSLTLAGSAASAFSLMSTTSSLILEFIGGLSNPVDADADGDVDGQDFLLLQRTNPSLIPEWQTQYGTGSSIAASLHAVPEPTSCLLALVAFVAVGSTRRNASKRSTVAI